MLAEGVGNLIGATIVFQDEDGGEGVIRWIYLKPVRYLQSWFGLVCVAEHELTAVVRDADGDLFELPVDELKLKMPIVSNVSPSAAMIDPMIQLDRESPIGQ